MNVNLWLPVIVALIQISDSYLRYLSFKSGMTEGEKVVFWRRIYAWSILAAIIYAIVLNSGVSPFAYKLIFITNGACYKITPRQCESNYITSPVCLSIRQQRRLLPPPLI